MARDFMDSCTAAGGTEASCGCAYDKVTETISFERFTEMEQQLSEDPSQIDELTAIIDECMGAT